MQIIAELRDYPWRNLAAGILPTKFQSKTAQIVPSASIAGNALTVVIAIMSFLACLTAGVADDVSAVVLANCTSGPAPFTVAADLVRIVAEAEPRIPEPWRPMREADSPSLELAGQWYWGTNGFALRLTADGLASVEPLSGAGRRSRFRANGDGTWTGLEGYFHGELLKAVRRPDGSVDHLDLGSFVFTRQPYDEGSSVPGGVDAEGWRGIG